MIQNIPPHEDSLQIMMCFLQRAAVVCVWVLSEWILKLEHTVSLFELSHHSCQEKFLELLREAIGCVASSHLSQGQCH